MKQSFGIISETARILGVTAFWAVTFLTVLFLFPMAALWHAAAVLARSLTGAALFRSAAAKL